MKLPDGTEFTKDDYEKVAAEWTKGWKKGDRIKVVRKIASGEYDPAGWVNYTMDDMAGNVYTMENDLRDNNPVCNVRLNGWFFPFYILENVDRPRKPNTEQEAIKNLKDKMDMLTKNKIMV